MECISVGRNGIWATYPGFLRPERYAATGMIAPTIASHLIQSVSEVAPIWMATVALAVNGGLFELFFMSVRPPERNKKILIFKQGYGD